ncbi:MULTISPECIES: hypothetical protein [unclassified Streptomyces]|uniref:hypothetical protein n=1 Tax=unclassified Streptomyces TaxID=2593676 RepID=UPI0038189B02
MHRSGPASPSTDAFRSSTRPRSKSPRCGGFTSRKDIKATDPHATALAKIMNGVEIFTPDRHDIDKNLDSYVDAWRTATGG